MTLRNLYYNYISHPNYFDDGGIVYIQDNNGFVRPNSVQTINGNYTSGINPQNAVLNDYQLNQVNKAERKQTSSEKAQNFIDNMNGGGASGWNAIGPAASNIASAFLDTESDLADRIAAAMGMPALAKQWTADTTKGNQYLKDLAIQNTGIKKPNYIQDASSAWGANNAIKLNAQNNISPISSESALPSLKDFKGNWWRNTGAAVAQGAASGSVGGPWGALGGAVTGLFGSIGGLFGRQKRANAAYKDFLARRDTLMSARQAQFNKANIDQTLSNMQALANGNLQQRINDMGNIRAFGGNLYNIKAMGGNLYTDLSPNMMNLWNNKQAIDQKKVNMQQMNFGLGNSFNQKLNTFDYGGSVNGMDLPTGMQSYENGGTHEQNPYGGIQVGVDQQGNPNLVEEGEFRWGDYIFSDRISVDPTLLSRYNLAPATKHQGKKANKGKLSYADMAKKYAKKNGELADDPIGKNTLEAYMKRLQDAQEDQKFQDSMEQQKQDAINQYRNALTTPQQGNPMYGAMKYNGMGNAATQQGVNAGMSDLGQQGGGNEVLSNTNRSGNNMLHAMGGNLYPVGGWLGKLFGKKQAQDNNQNYGNEWRVAPQQDDVIEHRPFTLEEILTYPELGRPSFYNELRNKHHVQYDPFLKRNNSYSNDLWGYINADYNNSLRYPDGMALPPSGDYYFTNDYREEGLKYDENGNLISKWGYEPYPEPYPYKGGYNYRNTYRDFLDFTNYNFPGLQPMGSPAYWDVVRGQIDWNPYKGGKPEDIIYSNINSAGQFSDPEAYSKISPNNLPIIPGITPEETRENYEKYLNSLDIKGRQQLLVNHGYNLGTTGDNGDGVDGDWGNKSRAAWDDFNLKRQTEYNTTYNTSVNNFRQQTGWDDNNLNLGVREGDATTDNNNLGNGQTSYNNAEGNTNTGRSNLTDGIKRDTTTTFGTAAIKGDQKQVPHYSTAGEYAMFGKGFTPMLYDWMNKTNFRYDPNQRPAYELADMGNNSTFLRTADTIGGYRAPNLMDAERMNNAAQAQGIAALQAALNVGNGNRGFAAAQTAQNAYNTQMGIGNNYATAQQANNEERYKTDAYNTAIDQFNANARNTLYQDNQKARQIGQQMAIDAKKYANDYILRNELYADATNRQAMDNRAANQATWTDNALNYFIAQAQKNDILNAKNNDITNPYWTDKNGVMHYIGDSGLNSAIYDAFTSDKNEWGNYAVNNGTFSGDRLKDWNKLLEKHGAAVLAANPDLWKSLVLQEKQERKKEAEKAELAKTDRLNNQRYAFDNNMAQLNNYRTLYGDKFTDGQWYDDLMKRYNDAANANEFNDVNNLEYWNRVIGDKLNYWQRYNTPVTANQSAYGGYINNNNKSNKREYYNYMRR